MSLSQYEDDGTMTREALQRARQDDPAVLGIVREAKTADAVRPFDALRQARPCERCGDSYVPKIANQRFCSVSCRDRAKRAVRPSPDEPAALVSTLIRQLLALPETTASVRWESGPYVVAIEVDNRRAHDGVS